MKKRIISFDLDGTLVDGAFGNAVWHDGIPRLYAQRHGMDIDEAHRTVLDAYDSIGEISLLWYDIDYWLNRFDLDVDPRELLDEFSRHITLMPFVEEVLDALKQRFSLVIASNAARLFVECEMQKTGLGRYFDRTISATSDFGLVKKEEAFFRRLADELKVAPEEMVHVGDHRVFDFEVPSRLGIQCYHYDPASENDGSVINDLRRLLEKL